MRLSSYGLVATLLIGVAAGAASPPVNPRVPGPPAPGWAPTAISQDLVRVTLNSDQPATEYYVGTQRLGDGATANVVVPKGMITITARVKGFRDKSMTFNSGDITTASFSFQSADRLPFGEPAPASDAVAQPVGRSTGRSGPRLALVIGNGDYSLTGLDPLPAAPRDAISIGRKLTERGFTLVEMKPLLNLDKQDMEAAMSRLTGLIHPGAVVVVYYSGHGLYLSGPTRATNFLVPIRGPYGDLRNYYDRGDTIGAFSRASEVLVDASSWITKLSGANPDGMNIIILDACRQNPFLAAKGSVGGLGQMSEMPQGTFIAWATSPGRIAQDGLYAPALVMALDQRGLDIFHFFNYVGQRVRERNKDQIPWVESSPLSDPDFQLVPATRP